MTDIVERLRGLPIVVTENGRTGISRMGGALLSEAADEIEKLREERNRLREALRPFAGVLKGNWSNQSNEMVMSFGFGEDKRLELTLGDFRNARAALKEKE